MLANFNRKEYLRHRAVSLRQHGFLVLPVSLRIDIRTVRFLDRFKVSENSLCNVFREQASRHMNEFSIVNLVCLNCRGGGYYEMQYIPRSLVTASEL